MQLDEDDRLAKMAELHELHVKILTELWGVWKKWREDDASSFLDPPRYSRLTVMTYLQVAAITAVDVGMPLEQFLAVCKSMFEEADKKAPKFTH